MTDEQRAQLHAQQMNSHVTTTFGQAMMAQIDLQAQLDVQAMEINDLKNQLANAKGTSGASDDGGGPSSPLVVGDAPAGE